LHHQVGEDETARDYSQHARDLATEIGAHSLRGYALNLLGHAYHGLGDLPRAAAMYARAYHLRLELNDARAAMEARAGMARVALAQGNLAQAQSFVEDILRHLERDSVEGTEEPFLVYLTCVQVLRANQDVRARQVLDAAHALLQGCAQKIADDAMRQSFLQNIPAHRELMRALRLIVYRQSERWLVMIVDQVIHILLIGLAAPALT
jgi:tetratricopeptide (TPR) repeat protein